MRFLEMPFTYYNILEPARYIGLANYINLILQDDIFLISVKNTFIIAVITGPIGYILSFMFAWFINELPRWLRSLAVVIFYAPSIAGNAYFIFSIIFRGDVYGYLNSFLVRAGIINAPILWLTDPRYMMPVVVLVLLWVCHASSWVADGKNILMTVYLAAITPACATVTSMAQLYDRDAAHSSALYVLTTLLSIVSMPVMIGLFDLLL